MGDSTIFATLRGGGRIWCIAAVHGEVDRLARVHGAVEQAFRPGDQVIYLGDILGYGPAVREAVDQILLFRRALLARAGVSVDDVVCLRGSQEEMWSKLLQLQFAPEPATVLGWMGEHGIDATISSYGGSIEEGLLAAREGVLALTKWTGQLRQAMRLCDGHTQLMSALKHAAWTDDGLLLFVSAGIDPNRPLDAQLDAFWWEPGLFDTLEEAYGTFSRVVRGSDLLHRRRLLEGAVLTLDGGCGFGGPLTAACFGSDGELLHLLEG
ncbi:MAG: hypothetical protein HY985_07260 [Magnetospirillum sp.]|nr:hypothetical protein [Magnetospirillum sp.]